MTRTKIFSLIMSVISLLLLSGCVSLMQEITVHDDGSGTLLFAIGVENSFYSQFQSSIPEGFVMTDLLESLLRQEGVGDAVQDQYQMNGYTWDTFSIAVEDFPAVFENGRRIGPVTMTITESDEGFIFRQTVDVASSPLNIPGVNLMDLRGSNYSVRLVAPQIMGTNGVQPSSDVSTWSVPLAELLQEGQAINLRADYTLEPYEGTFIPWEIYFPYVVIGFLSLGGLAILVVIVVNTAGKREDTQGLRLLNEK